MTEAPAIDIQDLSLSYESPAGRISVLEGLNFSVPAGQVFGFLGPNGAGKTSTMHILLGFTEPQKGSARLFGTDVRTSIARQRIGYLAENPDTYRFLTGSELLYATGQLFLIPKEDLNQRVPALLSEVDLSDAADRRVASYSRGMLQRICLAQALINDPDLLILDEPTSGLDPLARLLVRDIIARHKNRGKTVFFSSHELSEVETVCDHVAILHKGKIVAQGPVQELVPESQSLEQYFLECISS